MTSAVQAIAIAAPTAIAQGIFAVRRANSCVDSFSDNPIYGSCNGLISGSQVLKATRAAADIKPVGEAMESAATAIKNTSLAADITKDVSTVTKTINSTLSLIGNFINPFICITSLAKVIFGDEEDKVTAGVKEGISIATMFGFENAYKKITGMPNISFVKGKQVSTAVEGLYKKNKTASKWVEQFVEKCNTTKLFDKIPMNSLPSVLKGLGFAIASIVGYKVGSSIANLIDNND